MQRICGRTILELSMMMEFYFRNWSSDKPNKHGNDGIKGYPCYQTSTNNKWYADVLSR